MIKTVTLNRDTYEGKVFSFLLTTEWRKRSLWFLSSYFVEGKDGFPFIGYEAPTVFGKLQKKGLVVSRWNAEIMKNPNKRNRKEYQLAPGIVSVECLDGTIYISIKENQPEPVDAKIDTENLFE